jgi:hypothetical protein
MTVTAVQITRRPAPTDTTPESDDNAVEPAGVVIVVDIEALTGTNQRACSDDNPYR